MWVRESGRGGGSYLSWRDTVLPRGATWLPRPLNAFFFACVDRSAFGSLDVGGPANKKTESDVMSPSKTF